MPTFAYRARDKDGRMCFGVELASSQSEALRKLQEKGLRVIELREQREHPLTPIIVWAHEAFNIFKPKAKHYAVFFRSLASALSAGMTPHEAFGMLSSSAPHKALRKFASEGKALASSGLSLAHVFLRRPHLFPRMVTSIIQVGEESGRLDSSLNLLAEYYEREHEHSLEVKRETFYPMLLGAFLIFYLSGLNPLIQCLIGKMSFWGFLSTFLKGASSYVLAIAFCYFAIRGLFASPFFGLVTDAVLLSFPVVGGVRRRMVEARFLRALAMLQASGVDAGRSLLLAGEASGSKLFEACCSRAASLVRDGKRISEALAIASKHLLSIQPTTLQLLSTAEATGRLDDLLPTLATQYEQEAFTTLRQRAVMLGVLMLLVVALIIGIQVINFYLGYYGALFTEQ